MKNYKIILDEARLDQFIACLPTLEPHEVWYITLFGRHKYDETFPNTRDSRQLVRVIARDGREFKEKIWRMESPVGSYSRDGIIASQKCLALYVTVNPRSLIRANKGLLIELAERFADGQIDFNPISVSTTAIHRSVGRKFFVDFDFDNVDLEGHRASIAAILPDPAIYRILRTKGGFHLLVELAMIKGLKTKWHQSLSELSGCDSRGSDTLIPVPGCTQGDFCPHYD